MGNSTIEWTDKTWNPVTGCTKVSAGCKNCYAERVFPRTAHGQMVPEETAVPLGVEMRQRKFTDVRTHPDRLDQPLHWRKPARIFVNSMSDLFHEDVPFEFIDKVFLIMAACRKHTFQILTKRPARMLEYCGDRETARRLIEYGTEIVKAVPELRMRVGSMDTGTGDDGIVLENVWVGVSVEDQKTADERIPLLLQTPAAIRFVSYEPGLGPVDFTEIRHQLAEHSFETFDSLYEKDSLNRGQPRPRLDWIIVGGESRPGARPFSIQSARDVIAQGKAAGVACFVKQLGKYPAYYCSQCGRDIGRGFLGGFVDACGPTHAVLIGELMKIRDSKGGSIEEWPEDLRVREFPHREVFV